MPANDLHLRPTVTWAPASTGKLSAPTISLIDWNGLKFADRACCCGAKPAVIVVMPPSPGRPEPTELLLCSHHYRESEPALAKAGAAVFSPGGTEITADDRWLIGAAR